ncbi:MAG: hypothetical protein GY898_08635 [Proteobacteria bacterium]|nr:hypothetical protein [Pseudomonadota bacterium]
MLGLVLLLMVMPSVGHADDGGDFEAFEAEQRRSRAMVGVTLGVQIGMVAATVTDLALQGAVGYPPLWTAKIPMYLTTVPLVPVGVAGFESLLADRTAAGRVRARGIGFLEGAGYAGAIGGLNLLQLATYRPSFEDITPILLVIYSIPHMISAGALLGIGLGHVGMAARMEAADADVALRARRPGRLSVTVVPGAIVGVW